MNWGVVVSQDVLMNWGVVVFERCGDEMGCGGKSG